VGGGGGGFKNGGANITDLDNFGEFNKTYRRICYIQLTYTKQLMMSDYY